MKNDDIRKLDFNGWPLTDEYLIEVGRVAALWASLESLLNLCIAKLVGFDEIDDQKPFILVNHASFPQRLDMLGTLCELLVKQFPNLERYKDVIGLLRASQSLRNKYMHHGMVLNEETGNVEMAIGSARGSLKVSVEKITIPDIRRASMAVHEAHLALYKLVLCRELQPVWKQNRQ
jgi:hypothetical protein